MLKQLKMAAAEEQPELVEPIGRAAKTNPPAEVEELMRKNAATIAEGRHAPAAQSALLAAWQLDALAQDFESIRRSAIAPQLNRLLAAEKQAAELQERLRMIKQTMEKGQAEKDLTDFARLLDTLAGQGSLRQSADQLINATQSSHTGWVRSDTLQPGESGYFVPPVACTGGLGAAILALQAKIQEIVLDNALIERIGPVPPQYKDLVEDYYRVLSQDLR